MHPTVEEGDDVLRDGVGSATVELLDMGGRVKMEKQRMDQKPSFAELPLAIEFMARALEGGEHHLLSDACLKKEIDIWELLPPEVQRHYIERHGSARLPERLATIARLAAVHRATPLRSLYAGRAFPEADSRFKLGGHAQELGYVHVDFVRATSGWQLEDIWKCR